MTTAAYKTAIKASSRTFTCKAEIYFASDPVIFYASDIVSMIPILEEAYAEGESPLGSVSSNTMTLTLRNASGNFTPSNSAGTYYDLLKPGTRVIPYIGLKVSGAFEYICMGTFYTGDWDAPTESTDASVVCYDKLYKLGELDVPMIPVMENQTRATMFETLFKAISLTAPEYEIDARLTEVVPIGYYIDGKVKDALSQMAIAFSCIVYMDRDNVIQVKKSSFIGTETSLATWNDTNMINTANFPQKTSDIYTDVEVTFSVPYLKDTTSVLFLDQIMVPSAGLTITNAKFSSGPVAIVDYIHLSNSQFITAGAMSIGAWGISIVLTNNSGATIPITIEVFGHVVGVIEDKVTVRDSTAYGLIGEAKILTINNYLVQSAAVATTYANTVLPIVSSMKAYVEAYTRGDPSILINDIVTLVDATDLIETTDVALIRNEFNFDGGLDCKILGINTTARGL